MKAYLEIEMPACINCRFCQAGDSTSYCLAQSHELECGGWYMHHIKWDEGIGYEAQKTWREKTCPLVPVPPHGGLIDADALCERLKKVMEIKPHLEGAFYAAISFALTAPTIIEAESYSERELQRDYEASVEYAQHCERYEPTYDPETGAM